MTNPLRLSYINHADIASISGASSVASLPLSNLKTDDIQELWRSAEVIAQQAVIADLGAVRVIGCVALINSNVFTPCTFHVRISTSDPTGLDANAYSAFDITGIPSPVYPKFVHFVEPQVSGRYVRITKNNLTTPPEAGRLIIGEVWAPTRDMRYGFEPLWRDHSVRSRSLGGMEYIDVRPRQRGWRCTILGLTETEAQEQVDRLNRLRGIGRDILVCRNKDSTDLGRDTIWGLLEQPVTQRKVEGRGSEGMYEIEIEVWNRVLMPVTVSGISAILADGVRETTQTTGAGTYSLDGAAVVEGITYRTFVAGVGSGNSTVYTVRSGSQFEIGIGTVTSGAPATLTRSVILKSSNSNNAVSWGVGVKDVIIDCPSDVLHSLQAQLDNALTRIKTTVFTASGTFTTDADCLFAHARGVSGGGAGGGAAATSVGEVSEGGGGGGGEYAEGFFTAAQLGASKVVTIGAGGTGVSASTGNSGGTTSLGSLITMLGGGGGARQGPSSADFTFPGGGGGTGGSGGFFRIPGSNGGPPSARAGRRECMCHGGPSHLSGSRTHDGDAGAGKIGLSYGGGGSGASNGGAGFPAAAGGAGAAGILIIVEYCKT